VKLDLDPAESDSEWFAAPYPIAALQLRSGVDEDRFPSAAVIDDDDTVIVPEGTRKEDRSVRGGD
jgi:hypothetical protein